MNDDSRNLMVSIELTPDEHEQITTLAVAEERDVPHQIRALLKEALAARAKASKEFSMSDLPPNIQETILQQQRGLTTPFLGGGSMTWPKAVVSGRLGMVSGSHSP